MSYKSQKAAKEGFQEEALQRQGVSESEKRRAQNALIGEIEDPFALLYKDITKEELKLILKEILKGDYYSLKDHSLNCLDISKECRKVIPRKVGDWISNILKASDILLLFLVQKVLNEEITVYGNRNKERDIYNHIEDIDEYKDVGSGFNAIYDKRNSLEHKQKFESESGEILIKDMSNKKKNKALQYCIKELKECLPKVIEKLGVEYPKQCIN